MTGIVRTKIFAGEEREFRTFLEGIGFSGFVLTPTHDKLYLNIEFKTPASIMNYKLRAVEESYRASRSNAYYYDLDQSWDDEVNDFFGDNNNDN